MTNEAEALYLASTFDGDVEDADIERCLADLTGPDPATALSRGKLLHCLNAPRRRADPDELACFVRAEHGFDAAADRMGLADALFWQGCYHQVLGGDDDAAVTLFDRALGIARETDERLVASYCLRHLGIAAHNDADLATANDRLTESTRLRRDLGFAAGVAANLVGLTYVSLGLGDRHRARRCAAEAVEIARAAGAGKVLADAEVALAQVGA